MKTPSPRTGTSRFKRSDSSPAKGSTGRNTGREARSENPRSSRPYGAKDQTKSDRYSKDHAPRGTFEKKSDRDNNRWSGSDSKPFERDRKPRSASGETSYDRKPRFASNDRPTERKSRFAGSDRPTERKPRFADSDRPTERKPRFADSERPTERKPRFSDSDRPIERKPRFADNDQSSERSSESRPFDRERKSRFPRPGGSSKRVGDTRYGSSERSSARGENERPERRVGGAGESGSRYPAKREFSSESRFRKSTGGERPFSREEGRSSDRPNVFKRRDQDGAERSPRRPHTGEGFDSKPSYRGDFGRKSDTGRRETGGASRFARAPRKPYDDSIRLNKYIANSGVCSRREADELIKNGAITVNGAIVTEMGIKVKLEDVIMYGDERLKNERKVYILLNKPKDYITTSDDPQERRIVTDLVRNACKERVFPVGRLDRNTTGLLLMTNDGDMAKKLTHPRHGVRKLYHVHLDKPLTRSDLDQIAQGVKLDSETFVKPDIIAFVEDAETKKEIGIEVHSGQNRVVRRIFEHFGYQVTKLDRVMFAGLTKKDLPRGKWRFLSDKEIGFLKMLK